MSLYEELGIDPDRRHEEGIATDIKRAYRHLVLSLHPDRGGGKEDTARLIRVFEAYRVLSDPVLKKQYDDGLSDSAQAGGGDHQPPSFFRFDWKEVVLFMAECIPVDTSWGGDVVVRLKDPLHAVAGRLVMVEYLAWRHHVSGSVVAFDMETLRVTVYVDPGIDYATEYLTVVGAGNDVLDCDVIQRGDVLIEVST